MELKEKDKKSENKKMFFGMIGASLMSLMVSLFEGGIDSVYDFLMPLVFFVSALYFRFMND